MIACDKTKINKVNNFGAVFEKSIKSIRLSSIYRGVFRTHSNIWVNFQIECMSLVGHACKFTYNEYVIRYFEKLSILVLKPILLLEILRRYMKIYRYIARNMREWSTSILIIFLGNRSNFFMKFQMTIYFLWCICFCVTHYH